MSALCSDTITPPQLRAADLRRPQLSPALRLARHRSLRVPSDYNIQSRVEYLICWHLCWKGHYFRTGTVWSAAEGWPPVSPCPTTATSRASTSPTGRRWAVLSPHARYVTCARSWTARCAPPRCRARCRGWRRRPGAAGRPPSHPPAGTGHPPHPSGEKYYFFF